MFKIFNKIKLFLILFFVLFLSFAPFNNINAQTSTPNNNFSITTEGAASLGVAQIVELVQKNVKDGSIVTSSKQGVILSNIPYDPQVLGVVARDAAIVFSTSDVKNGVPIIPVGRVYLLVSTKDGIIKRGDQITTSTIPGVGVKATKDGYVLGVALEDYTNTNQQQIGKIALNLELHYFNAKPTLAGSLSDIFKFALLPTKEGPAPIFKYIVAAGVVLASIVFGFLSFGRTAAKGVEALGRNPAAGRIIQLGIIFNVIIVIAIIIAGLSVAFLILRL
jgi:F0F1-type ATP synthase membrane subunit c/vacuolar-type H+-ATPase subunit K